MFIERYVNEELAELILPRDAFHPFPTVDDRKEWECLPAHLTEYWVSEAEKHVSWQWPSLPATVFMEFVRNGNRSRFEERHFARRKALSTLVIAECIEDQGRFLDDIINGIWCICEESFWGVSAHNYISQRSKAKLPDVTEPIIDLFAGETAGLLAITHYLLRTRLDQESELVSERIRLEMRRRILDPYLARDDFWWMGLATDRQVNNWNPWCNSNCLTAFLLIEENEERRISAVNKAMRSLDQFIKVYHADGGCDEGTSYWDRAGGALLDCLELLRSASRGRIDLYEQPLVQEIGRFLYRSFIHDEYYINFADGGAKNNISANLVFRYGQRICDPKLMALGAAANRTAGEEGSSGGKWLSLLRQLPALFNASEIEAADANPPYVRDVWLDGIEVMAAREQEGTHLGLYLAVKGGHNNESHNHNDVGNFVVYVDGRPFLIDVGVETYTAKTFSPSRYEIWTMQSGYHNLPSVNGLGQQAGADFRATQVSYESSDRAVQFALNLERAYPPEAGIIAWQRSFYFNRSGKACLELADQFELHQADAPIALSLMTPHRPVVDEAGTIHLTDEVGLKLTVITDPSVFDTSTELIEITDGRLHPVWGDRLYRILLQKKTAEAKSGWLLRIEQE
ncbi:MAG: Heparinase family protein [Bacilli bacterium]|nr:Heparinase family protein [Bacilli bacterium]